MISMRPIYSKLVTIFIAAAALGIVYGSLRMPMGSVLAPGAGLVPFLLAGAAFVLAIVAAVLPEPATTKAGSDPKAEGEDQPEKASAVPRPLLIMIVLGLVIFGFERAGFMLSLLGGLFILLWFVERRPLALSLSLSLSLSVGLYFLFSKFLYVSLPAGWLEF